MPKMWRNSLYTDIEYGDYSFNNVKNCDEDFYDFEVTDTEGLEDTHNDFCACRMYGSRISDRRSMLYNSNSRVQGIRKC